MDFETTYKRILVSEFDDFKSQKVTIVGKPIAF